MLLCCCTRHVTMSRFYPYFWCHLTVVKGSSLSRLTSPCSRYHINNVIVTYQNQLCIYWLLSKSLSAAVISDLWSFVVLSFIQVFNYKRSFHTLKHQIAIWEKYISSRYVTFAEFYFTILFHRVLKCSKLWHVFTSILWFVKKCWVQSFVLWYVVQYE